MPQYLTLSRAARLVGVKRGTLQARIHHGELSTFEGMVELSELLRAYPQAQVDDPTMIEYVGRIRANAFAKRVQERTVLPDIEVLTARVERLSAELLTAQTKARRYTALMDQLVHKLRDFPNDTAARGLEAWLAQAIADADQAPLEDDQLAARDTWLRIMEAHVRVFPSGHDFFLEGQDTLLQAGLRAGYALNYGCSDGSCGQCTVRVVAGRVKRIREHAFECDHEDGLQVLACCYTAVTDVELLASEAGRPDELTRQRLSGRISRIERHASAVVFQLRTPPSQRLRFLAGQRASLSREPGQSLRAPIASCPCEDGTLQFHVAPTHDGMQVARWQVGDELLLEGPTGSFVLDTGSPRSLIFIAFDTGFAAVKGMIEQAMSLDVAETIHLYWRAAASDGHYQHNLCRAWEDALDNFRYVPLGRTPSVRQLFTNIAEQHTDLAAYDIYVAAPEEATGDARAVFLTRGLPSAQLKLDEAARVSNEA